MLTVPLYIFFGLYLLLFIIFLFFFVVNIIHLVQTGSLTFVSFAVTFLFLAAAAMLIYATLDLLEGVDWKQGIIIFNKEWFVGLFVPKQTL